MCQVISVSGRPGRLPAQAPHRSGRAEFPHPALRAHGFAARRQTPHTCWTNITRQLSYPMQSRLDGSEVRCPLHLSLHRFHAPAPPSLLRVPLGSVPRTHRYYGTLRLPAIHPGGLVDSPAGTVLALLLSLPPLASTTFDGPGFWSSGSPTGFLRTEITGSPEFPSDLLDTCPAPIRPRRDRSARPFGARDVAFRS
jgi:hypothetical protein